MWWSRSLMDCTCWVVRCENSSSASSASATCPSRSAISTSEPFVSWAKLSSCVTRLPAAWRLWPMLSTDSCERSTAPPCRRAASSSTRTSSDTPWQVRRTLPVTRCTWLSARRRE